MFIEPLKTAVGGNENCLLEGVIILSIDRVVTRMK